MKNLMTFVTHPTILLSELDINQFVYLILISSFKFFFQRNYDYNLPFILLLVS